MFEFVRTHRRWVMFVMLVLIIPPFAFFGVDRYFHQVDDSVAKVGSTTITQQEFDSVQRERIEQARQQAGPTFDAKVFETPEARAAILDGVLIDRALALEADRAHVTISDAQLYQIIASIPAFQDNGVFSKDRFQAFLAGRQMSGPAFEARVRADLRKQVLMSAIAQSAIVPKTTSDAVARMLQEAREIRIQLFRPDEYLTKVNVTDEALKKYYDENPKRFETPENVKVEYLVLSPQTVSGQVTVPDSDIADYYEKNKSKYGAEEQRRASHILITTEGADKDAARKKALEILKQVRANPNDFAKLAKENSKDPGSAEKGGDLGFFDTKMMVKPFSDAAFSMKPGQISDLIESDFGFHIIKLTAIKEATTKPLAEVRAEIEQQLRADAAQRKFTESAEQFTNTVFEQADSLKPAAEKLKLTIQTADRVPRQGLPAQAGAPQLFTTKLMDALFADDSLKNKRNTQAIEVAPNTLVAGHVVEYRPAALRSFDEAKPQIHQTLARIEALRAARDAGVARLAELKKAPSDVGLSPAAVVSREASQGMPPAVVNDILRVPADKVPGFIGIDVENFGYLVVNIVSVKQPEAQNAARRDAQLRAIAQQAGAADDLLYADAVKRRYDAKVTRPELAPSARIDSKDEAK